MKLALVIGSAAAVIFAASRTDVAALIASASQAPAAAAPSAAPCPPALRAGERNARAFGIVAQSPVGRIPRLR